MNSIVDKLYVLSRSQKFRNLIIQFVFLIFVGLFVYYLISKALQLDVSLSHFVSRAGFGISHTFLVDYSSNDSRWFAYFTGVVNTIRMCLVGIILATILGISNYFAYFSRFFGYQNNQLIDKIGNKLMANFFKFFGNISFRI